MVKQVLFIGLESDPLVEGLAAHDVEVHVRPRLGPEPRLTHLNAVVTHADTYQGYSPAGVPLVILGPFTALRALSSGRGVAYLAEQGVRIEELWRALSQVWSEGPGRAFAVRAEEMFARHDLTPKERAAVRMLLSGMRDEDIARAAGVSPKTVKNHLQGAYHKFDVRSRTELTAKLFPL